jgi:hypothetical protein
MVSIPGCENEGRIINSVVVRTLASAATLEYFFIPYYYTQVCCPNLTVNMAVSVEMGQPLKTACRFPVLRYKEDDAFEKLTHERTNIQVLSKGRVQDLLSQEETSLQGLCGVAASKGDSMAILSVQRRNR